jgi:hypothetical protein
MRYTRGILFTRWERSEKACAGLYPILKWGYQSGHWYRHQVRQYKGGNIVCLATAVHSLVEAHDQEPRRSTRQKLGDA